MTPTRWLAGAEMCQVADRSLRVLPTPHEEIDAMLCLFLPFCQSGSILYVPQYCTHSRFSIQTVPVLCINVVNAGRSHGMIEQMCFILMVLTYTHTYPPSQSAVDTWYLLIRQRVGEQTVLCDGLEGTHMRGK